MHHHRPVVLRTQPRLIGRAEVVAVLEWRFKMPVFVRLVEHLSRFVVTQPRERRNHVFELRHVAADHLQLGARYFSTLCTMCEM